MKQLKKRKEFVMLLKDHGVKVGAEIGVFKGGFSACLMRNLDLNLLYMVDPWEDWRRQFRDDIYNECLEVIEPYIDRVKMMRMMSVDAAPLVPDESLDFVQIDANHSYESCKEDITLWCPKVKTGGIVSGHDYVGRYANCKELSDGKTHAGKCGVRRAVNEFVEEHGYEFDELENLTCYSPKTWWFVK